MAPASRASSRPGSMVADFYGQDPFRTPVGRGAQSVRASTVVSGRTSFIASCVQKPPPKQQRFKSSRLIGEYEKPWTEKRDHRIAYDRWIFYFMTLLGLGISAYICWDGWNSYGSRDFCLIWEDDFSNGIDDSSWNYEIQRGGFGSGAFDWTTDDKRNAYADSEGLHIVPTLTIDDIDITEAQLLDGYKLNLTTDGTCTTTGIEACGITSNKTTGDIINPIRSARLNTKGKRTITYGKVEIVAKLPKGDWLWPALWMMPEEEYYGGWPASGEIDIMESRGNEGTSYKGGRNEVGGTLHWGPVWELDMFKQTSGKRDLRRTDYSEDFHIFGVEWTEKYIFIYVDSVLAQTIYTPFRKRGDSLYQRGGFGNMEINETVPENPWAKSPNINAPFDRPFYLIVNVAVGTTNGYFPRMRISQANRTPQLASDGYGPKPWRDGAEDAQRQFWAARPVWEPSWGAGDSRGMTVKNVRMWNPGKCA
ncbi:unnamed protein product [Parascedosporium putredinis]|uniref:GH16 domain-containing protein n=1 Tax=Parascedosporium putredinis TaxID=1442378 RepID=A0A9P1M9R7_9PEZI|nr:unnamed protein product [Parascedosporium putredinis]CAI7992546.1 unnamed protein product [Parascedosporium putredinis]